MRRPDTPWLRELHDALLVDARTEIAFACKVAVLVAANVPRAEIARRLEVAPADVEQAVRKLRSVARQLEREDRPHL